MKKVISFSLWGDNPTYNIGAIKNAELAKYAYPDFECWFYIHKDTVPQETIDALNSFTNTKIIFKTGDLNKIKPMMWRFEAIDDDNVEIMMSRDTDTRFLLREKLAVDEWLKSDTIFHIMRDHPHHNFCILGGMFGTKKIKQLQNWSSIMNSFNQLGNRDYDQDFLRDTIYPLIKNNSIIHATFHKNEPHAKNFPINYCNNFKFVGEYVYSDNSRSIPHSNELRKYIYYNFNKKKP
jgi:protein O-GlcNAc transferase